MESNLPQQEADTTTVLLLQQMYGEIQKIHGEVQKVNGEVQKVNGEVQKVNGEVQKAHDEIHHLRKEHREDIQNLSHNLSTQSTKIFSLYGYLITIIL